MTREACLFSANGPHAGTQAGRRRQRSVLRTDFPVLLAPGSCGATHCARCARFVQTVRRKSDVRSALRARPRDCTARRRRQRAAWPRSAHAAPAARASSVVFVTHASAISNAATIGNVATTACRRAHRDDAGKGAGRPRVARLVRSREAHRSSFSRRLSERSSRSERSEFRRASRCGEHRRAPPRSGGKHPARPRRMARPLARTFARADPLTQVRW